MANTFRYPNPHSSIRWWATESAWVDNILYHPSSPASTHHVATILEEPPAALADNMALHLVPGCVWFQVEILIPEDPRNGLDHPLSNQRRDTPRWVEVTPDYTYVFVPDTAENRALVESQGLGSTNVSGLTNARISSFMKGRARDGGCQRHQLRRGGHGRESSDSDVAVRDSGHDSGDRSAGGGWMSRSSGAWCIGLIEGGKPQALSRKPGLLVGR